MEGQLGLGHVSALCSYSLSKGHVCLCWKFLLLQQLTKKVNNIETGWALGATFHLLQSLGISSWGWACPLKPAFLNNFVFTGRSGLRHFLSYSVESPDWNPLAGFLGGRGFYRWLLPLEPSDLGLINFCTSNVNISLPTWQVYSCHQSVNLLRFFICHRVLWEEGGKNRFGTPC